MLTYVRKFTYLTAAKNSNKEYLTYGKGKHKIREDHSFWRNLLRKQGFFMRFHLTKSSTALLVFAAPPTTAVPLHVDFDHVFVKTEKADATYSYKQACGYFPGVVSIDSIIAYIENSTAIHPSSSIRLTRCQGISSCFIHTACT